VLLAAWGPCGFAPVAPGTFGTLGAIPLAWAASFLPLAGQLALVLALTALGTVAAGHAARYWRVADASPIVIDEVVGYLVTLLAVPWSWPAAAAAFLLFRLTDVVKPWPASRLDRMKTAPAVILDDLAAGVWAWALLRLLAAGLARGLGCEGGPWYCTF
jgi:phosphatidylglycerophosphatase A